MIGGLGFIELMMISLAPLASVAVVVYIIVLLHRIVALLEKIAAKN